MDVTSFLTELLGALAELDFVRDVDLKTEGVIVSGRIILQNDLCNYGVYELPGPDLTFDC